MNKIFTFMMIIIAWTISAQDVTVTLSPLYKFPKNSSVPEFLCENNGEYYFLRSEAHGLFSFKYNFFLEKYNDSFEQVKSKEISVSKDDINYNGSVYINQKLALMISDNDKDRDIISYKIVPISLEGKSSKPITVSKFKYERKRDIPTTSWILTNDTTKILFMAESDNDSKKENYQIHLVSIDDNLNKIWDKTMKFSKTEAQVKMLSSVINPNGEVYLLYKIYDDKKREKKDDKAAYEIQLMYIKNDSAEVKKFALNISDKFIKSANLRLRDNGELYSVGLYSNTVDGPTHGVFFLKIVDGEVTLSTKREFSENDLEKLGKRKSDKDKSGEKGLKDNFRFNDMQIIEDGSAFVTVEPNYVVEYSSTNSRGVMSTSYVYYSEDIIIININPQGDIDRLSILPKFQSNPESTLFLSHKSFAYKDKVYLFYNEDEDNYKNPVGSKPKRTSYYGDFIATMTTLDKNGNFDRKALFSYEDSDSIFIPDSIEKISPSKYILVATKRKLFTSKSTYMFSTIQINN
ncbi:MAG: hypothetical protein KDC04_01830 [Saprospiraceae bacterium]|nr:hypothetical protein [Saprospiraceae bacterium]